MVIPAGFEFRNLNRRDCPLGRSLVSVDLTSDETSRTAGRQRFARNFNRRDSPPGSSLVSVEITIGEIPDTVSPRW